MLIRSTIRCKKHKRVARQVYGIVLFTVYIFGAFGLTTFHPVSHAHAYEVLHSADQEKDLCHRTLYHGDAKQGCHHSAHVVAKDKCGMCSTISHPNQVLPCGFKDSVIRFLAVVSNPEFQDTCCTAVTLFPSRAPPEQILFIYCL